MCQVNEWEVRQKAEDIRKDVVRNRQGRRKRKAADRIPLRLLLLIAFGIRR